MIRGGDVFAKARDRVSLSRDEAYWLLEEAPLEKLAAVADDVRRALADLPEGPRQVFLMRIEAELSFREIAETMDIPVGTALTWMQVAKVKLKKILGRLK